MTVLLLLALAARAWSLVTRPLWFDELFTLFAARGDLQRLIELLRQDSGPPLFYLLEHPIVRMTESLGLPDWWSRVVPFVAAAAILAGARALPPGLARRWFLLLAAISPLLLLHAAEARAYALVALLSFALFLLATRARESVSSIVTLALLAAAAMYAHYLGLFVVTALFLLASFGRRLRSAAGLAAGALLFLPWVPILLAQPEEATRWIRYSPLQSVLPLLAGLGGALRLAPALGGPLPQPILYAGAAAGLWLVVALVRAARREREIRSPLLFVGLTLGALLFVSLWRPAAYPGRTEMAVLPVWLWAAARGAGVDRSCRAAAGAAAVVALITGTLVLRAQSRVGSPWEPGTVALARVTRPGDLAVAAGPFYLPARLAAERGRVPAGVEAFPPELSEHPGWISPRSPFRDDGRLRDRAADCVSACRLFFLGYLPHFTGDVQEIFAKAGPPQIVWRHGEAVILQSAPRPPLPPPAF